MMTNAEAIEVLEDLWKYEHSEKYSEQEIREALDKGIQALDDRYYLIIRRSRYNVNRRFDDDKEEILVDAYDISLVCAYNIIKLYGNCVELKRLEGEDGKTI